jgi:hypothetical protein
LWPCNGSFFGSPLFIFQNLFAKAMETNRTIPRFHASRNFREDRQS